MVVCGQIDYVGKQSVAVLLYPVSRNTTAVFSNTQFTGTLPPGVATLFPASAPMWSTNCIVNCTTPLSYCGNAERWALVDLFVATYGAGWTNNSNWLVGSSPCSWAGVTCTGANVTYVRVDAAWDGVIGGWVTTFVLLRVCIHVLRTAGMFDGADGVGTSPCRTTTWLAHSRLRSASSPICSTTFVSYSAVFAWDCMLESEGSCDA